MIQPLAAQEAQFCWKLKCEAGCTIVADHELLHRMMLNLVLNALRETPTNGWIRMTATPGVTITVEDNGPGIPEGDPFPNLRPDVFRTPRAAAWVCRLSNASSTAITEQFRLNPRKAAPALSLIFCNPHNTEVVSEHLLDS